MPNIYPNNVDELAVVAVFDVPTNGIFNVTSDVVEANAYCPIDVQALFSLNSIDVALEQ